MEVRFTIGTSGHIGETLVFERDTTGSAPLANCVSEAFRGWRFPVPASPDAATATASIGFSPTPPMPPG
jgi:hypothetical protein